jgi:phosphatidylglycerol:prolipoprotein diacylglycerol transferase
MLPILFTIPGGALKVIALVLLASGLCLTGLSLLRGGAFKERWQGMGLAGLIAGVLACRLLGGSLAIHRAELWQATWPPFSVYSYGLMFGLSLFVGWMIVAHFGTRDGLNESDLGTCYTVAAVSSIVVARALYLVTQPAELQGGLLDMLNTRRGGLVAYGGLIGSTLGSIVYCRIKKMPLALWGDAAILAVALGTAVTRVGCLLYGCDYGRPAPTLPWGIRFPAGAPAHVDHVQRHLILATSAWSAPVHPTQIYESLLGLSAFLLLLWVRARRQFAGQLFLIFVLYYGALRYAIEVFRGDADRAFVGWFSTSQLISLLTMAVALGLYVILHRRARAAAARVA